MQALRSVGMVAGEASGDMLAAHLLSGMHARWPELLQAGAAHGVGGARLQAAGFDAWWPSERLAVRGYVEVLRHYWGIVGIRKQLLARWKERPPGLFVGVDAPDFNLSLEAGLRAVGVPTVHFISPSIWAWRPERIHTIGRSCDHVLCIFPFEKPLYDAAGIPATYVGHPLASVIAMTPDQSAARAALKLPPRAPVVAVLPGSRASEVQYLGARVLQAAKLLLQADAALQVVVPCVPVLAGDIAALARSVGLNHALASRLHLLQGQSHRALAACDVSLVASGTATLEAALFKKPVVIVYNMHPLSWHFTQRKRLQPWVGLPNILCNDFVVPELLQNQAQPDAMADAVLRWLGDAAGSARVAQRFSQLHEALQRPTVQLACDAIEGVLERHAQTSRV